MFSSQGLSEQPCFICSSKEDVLHVHFKGDNAKLPLCPKHLMEQIKKRSNFVQVSHAPRETSSK